MVGARPLNFGNLFDRPLSEPGELIKGYEVTSAAKVVVPGILDLLQVCIHNGLRLPKLRLGKTSVVGQSHLWCQPELRFTVCV